MASKRFAFVDEKNCVACGACKKECPKGAVKIVKGCYGFIDKQACIGCGKCEKVCPAQAIAFEKREA